MPTDNIFYRPHLEPERTYLSDAQMDRARTEYLPNVPSKPDRVKELIKQMGMLKKTLESNTNPLRHMAPVTDKLLQRLKVAFPGGEPPNPQPVIEVIPPIDETLTSIEIERFKATVEIENEECTVVFPQDPGIEVTVTQPDTTLNVAIASYARDSIDLPEYYLNSMRGVLQRYYNQMLTIAAGCGLPNYTYLTKELDMDKLNVSNPNDQHLKDYITRSQVLRQQKASLFKKTHNADQTMVVMRRWHAAEKERERYYSESYGDSSSFLGHESNELLRKSRQTYDEAYQQSTYNMYKYLDSSVTICGDILGMATEEAKAKGQLLKNGVDVLSAIKPETIKETLQAGEVVVDDYIASTSEATGGDSSSEADSGESKAGFIGEETTVSSDEKTDGNTAWDALSETERNDYNFKLEQAEKSVKHWEEKKAQYKADDDKEGVADADKELKRAKDALNEIKKEISALKKKVVKPVSNPLTTPSPEVQKKMDEIEAEVNDNIYEWDTLSQAEKDAWAEKEKHLKNVITTLHEVGISNAAMGNVEAYNKNVKDQQAAIKELKELQDKEWKMMQHVVGKKSQQKGK